MVAIDPLNFLVPVPGPQCPKYEVGPIGYRIQGEPIDTAELTEPVPGPDVVRMSGFGESGSLGLLGGEVALLQIGDLKEPPRGFAMRLL
jgi:hypothetical protein